MDQKYNEAVPAEKCENTPCGMEKSLTRYGSLSRLMFLDWGRVEQLQVRPLLQKNGESESEYASETEKGCYVNEDKSCVRIVGASEKQIQRSVMQCAGALDTLDLMDANVSGLHLSHLTNLRSLCLASCVALVELSGLGRLTQLTNLNLSGCSSLTALPGLEQLTQLTALNLSGCSRLTELPELDKLTQMRRLNLSRCSGLTSLPEGIRFMDLLRHLDLRGLHLRELPDWFPEIAEEFTSAILPIRSGKRKAIVYLRNATFEDVDMSIFDQPYEMVLAWMRERNRDSAVALSEIKVVFLGDGEAGKSHIIARVMNDGGEPMDYMGVSTPGIAIRNKAYEIDGRRAVVHFWDFGGQEILHSMHRMFLTDRTVYVIVVNARDDLQNERAKYWFQHIDSVAPDAPVLLVLNKIDQNPNASVDERSLRHRYKGLRSVIRLSALFFDMYAFNRAFTDQLLEVIQNTGYLDIAWPHSWMKIKNVLQNMDGNYLSGNEYQRICEEYQVVDGHGELLQWFNDLGISFCYSENRRLQDYVILRPEWITNAIYALIFNPIPGNKNGIIPHGEIFRILSNPLNSTDNIRMMYPDMSYTPGEVEYVLGVMRNFQLSFLLDRDREMIPMLCDVNASPVVYECEDDEDAIEFRLVYDYLPSNVIHRLMVDMRHDLDYDHVWRTGARFVSRTVGASAVVWSDDNDIRIIVRSEDSRRMAHRYLEGIRDALQSISRFLGLKEPESLIAYKDGGRTEYFDYEMLIMSLEYGETMIFSKYMRKKIPIQDILHRSDLQTRAAGEKLLGYILRSFMQMQCASIFRHAGEEMRTEYVRDLLRAYGYIVMDQTLRGTSSFKREFISMDLEIRLSDNEPFAVFDAFTIQDLMSFRRYGERRVQKMLDYAWNLPALYLASYVKCPRHHFRNIVQESVEHLRAVYGNVMSVDVDNMLSQCPYLAAVRCMFNQNGIPVEMYFVFAYIEDEPGQETEHGKNS